MSPFAKVVIVLAALLLGIYGIFAAYEGSWTLSKSVLSHQQQLNKQRISNENQNIQNGNANQQGQLSAFNNDDQQLNGLTAGPQAAAVARDMCSTGSQINGNTVGWAGYDKGWFNTNCNGGTLSPSSKYFVKN